LHEELPETLQVRCEPRLKLSKYNAVHATDLASALQSRVMLCKYDVAHASYFARALRSRLRLCKYGAALRQTLQVRCGQA